MTYADFAKQTPTLYGQIVVNGSPKIGAFKPIWNRYTNSPCYRYYTPGNRPGKGGFTIKKAYRLFEANRLSVDPEYGKPEFYL